MEIATATITILTFIKDIIAVAREIKRTVDKIPQNQQSARHLADDVLEGLRDIENFYRARGGVLEGSPELKEALGKLLKKTHDVYARCVQLFTPLSKRKGWQKIGATLKAWQDCDKVEREIAQLKDHVDGCYRRFLLMAVARLEEPVNQIHITTTRIERTLLNLNETQIVTLGHREGYLTSLQGPNSTDIAASTFIQPPIDVMNTLYLQHQIKTICDALAKISASNTFAHEEPNAYHLRPFKFSPDPRRISPTMEDTHRDVVAKTLEIIKLLKDDSPKLSIQDGAIEIARLSSMLTQLEMYSDAEAMGSWTVTMYRTLVAVHPAVYIPHLALALQNLSIDRMEVGDCKGAMAVIVESLDLQRRHIEQDSAPTLRSLLVTTLTSYWSITSWMGGDLDKCMQIAMEAVTIRDSVRTDVSIGLTSAQPLAQGQHSEPASGTIKDERAQQSATPLSTGWDAEETALLEYTTACALDCLAHTLEGQQRLDEAYEAQLRVLAICQTLDQNNGTIKENLAASYAHLASSSMRMGRPQNQSLTYAERAVEIYRNLRPLWPVRYTHCLLDSLWGYASLLHEAGRTDKVLRVTEEALTIIREFNTSKKLLANALHSSSEKLRNLARTDTAVILRTEAVSIYRTLTIIDSSLPSASVDSVDSVDPTVVPDALMDLANDFIVAGKADEAVEACKEAVNIYREQVAQTDSNESLAKLNLAWSLTYLCYCMYTAEDYDAASKPGKEAIAIYRNQYRALGANFKEFSGYILALRRTSASARRASDAQAISTNAAVVEELEMLILEHSEAVGKRLLYALHTQISLLVKHRRVREAIQVNERMLKLIGPLPITDVAIAVDYITAANSYFRNLFRLGRPKDALQALERATEMGRSFPDDDVSKGLACALATVEASQAYYLYAFGRYAEAEGTIKRSIDASHKHLRLEDDMVLAFRYMFYSRILRNIPGRFKEALEFGQKAVALCRGSTTSAMSTEDDLAYILHGYGVCVAESGDDHQALCLIQESIKLYRKIRGSNDPLVPWVFAEPKYTKALLDLGSCLMAHRHYEDAYEALVECEMICQDLMTTLPARFVEYVVCLDLLSINRGALGLDNEEKRFSEDLDSRQNMMEACNPQLATITRINLERLRNSQFQVRLRQFLKANRVGGCQASS